MQEKKGKGRDGTGYKCDCKGQHEGDFCGNGRVLYLNYSNDLYESTI